MWLLTASESPRSVALVRIALGAVLAYEAAVHWPYAVELYSADGLPIFTFPGTALEVQPLPALPTVCLHTAFVFTSLAVALGWQTRLSLIGTLGLLLWFGLIDLPGTFAKYTILAAHVLFLLSWSACGRCYSLDGWVRPPEPAACWFGPVWPRFLMRMLLCSVYAGAALTKLQLTDYASGDLLLFSLLDERSGATSLGMWLAGHRNGLVLASLGALAFESLFPVLIWFAAARRPLLALAVLFHVTLGLVLSVGNFSPVMLAVLPAFLTEQDLQQVRWLPPVGGGEGSERRGRAAMSLVAYVCAAGVFCAVGTAVQWQADWYGVFRAAPSPALTEIPAGEAAVMLAGQRPQEADFIQSIEIGSRVNGARVFGGAGGFERGAYVHVLVQLTLPHPALRLEGLLLAPDGQEVGRFEQPVDPERRFITRAFELTESLPPGRYRILLQANGYEVGRQTFELRGAEAEVPAETQ